MLRYVGFLFVTLALNLVAGCAAKAVTDRQYPAGSLSMSARTIEATVVSKREVVIMGTTGVGGAAGAVIGGAGGSRFGRSARGSIAGALTGAVIGGLVGAAIEASATQQDAFEYIVQSDVTGLMTLLQLDGEAEVGDSVFVVLSARPVLVKNQLQANAKMRHSLPR